MKTPQDVLFDAVGILYEDGWQQGSLCQLNTSPSGEVPHSPVCAIGSINRAATGYANISNAAAAAAVEAVGKVIPSSSCDCNEAESDCVAVWNDVPERTLDEVAGAMVTAAISLMVPEISVRELVDA